MIIVLGVADRTGEVEPARTVPVGVVVVVRGGGAVGGDVEQTAGRVVAVLVGIARRRAPDANLASGSIRLTGPYPIGV